TSDLQISNPQATVTINRDRAGALGVTAQQVEEALYDAYGSRQVSTIYTPTNQYWVVMELLPQYQQDLSALNLLYIRSQNIMLVGLVKKNGIMMIDFALEAQRIEGKSAREAILQACSIRFRPIMMTTMAALMGTLPIALGVGVGSESRRPLGIAVVGGLAFS